MYGWTPEQVNGLTRPQIEALLSAEQEQAPKYMKVRDKAEFRRLMAERMRGDGH